MNPGRKRGREGEESVPPEPDFEIKKARSLVFRYLTSRPRSRSEVEKKLADARFSPEVVQTVLIQMEREGYLDDAVFSRDFAESLVKRKSCGIRYVEHKLLERGIDPALARETARSVFPSEDVELEGALKAARKKLKTLKGRTILERKRKMGSHLSAKGFSSGVIQKVFLTGLLGEDPEVES